ncbi:MULTISPECIES: hypothetical protein [unclassified Vibrio]|uniref:hypothetical protein n=1 Tax=unclassified Vibrio TaxID=2614977 RepID=UPI0013614343|nr:MULTISPECIES: hypothetical protein [unclassified Vibrio]NAW55934.1 hypothetical protein [Vibrio sp. V36_P2S2PM302]NAX20161.1 hypothetical protein [Vibrio sp. V39_P1S14PM300]NAX26516.1 hypothetical protein [Vibrio sp. V38_P2S17PM301]
MIWRLLVLITATALITLPSQAKSVQCNEKEWNKALAAQKRIDDRYNFHANKFNFWLSAYHRQVFLHDEFSSQELVSFWQSDKQQWHLKLEGQIRASRAAADNMNIETLQLRQMTPAIRLMESNWLSLNQACEEQGFALNMITSAGYIQVNQKLRQEVQKLMEKLEFLRSRYSQEAESLENARQPSQHN